MYSETESSLVLLCLKGNRTAQRTMYKRYCDAMYNICYRLMGNAPEAEDMLQESFMDVFRRLDSFRGESSLGAWIKRIVINHCLNQLKKRKVVFQEMTDTYMDAVSETDDEDDVDVYEVKRVRDAIMTLPDGYRQVLTLYLIEGYDHGEIAGIMGIQETGSKSQYSRARSRLREILKTGVRT